MSQIIYKSIVTTAGKSNFFKIDFYHKCITPGKALPMFLHDSAHIHKYLYVCMEYSTKYIGYISLFRFY